MIKKIFLLLPIILISTPVFGLEIARDAAGGGRGGEFVRPQFDEQVNQLWLACKKGDEQTVAQLLQNGVDPNTRLFFEAPLDEEGCDDSTCLHYAANAGHLGVVDLLFRFGARTNMRDQNGWIPLIGALANGHEAVVDRLIERGAQINSIDSFLGHRPIATPVQCLNPRLVRRLLSVGATVIPPLEILHNGVPLQRIYQGNALHILCERLLVKPVYAPEYDAQEKQDRALEIIEMVRAHGIDMSHKDSGDNTVYHAAARLNDRRIMAALMVSTNNTPWIKKAALAKLRAFLLVNQRKASEGLAALPQDAFLRIFSFLPIECKQAGIEQLVVPHCTDAVSMRTRYLDACLVDLKTHSFHTADEGLAQVKLLGMLNTNQQQACDVTQDALLKNVLNPITWH